MLATEGTELDLFVEQVLGVDLLRVVRLGEVVKQFSGNCRYFMLDNKLDILRLLITQIKDKQLRFSLGEKLFNFKIVLRQPQLLC